MKHLPFIGCALLALAGGVIFGRFLKDTKPVTEAERVASGPSSAGVQVTSAKPTEAKAKSHDERDFSARLSDTFRIGDPLKRKLAQAALIDALSAAEIRAAVAQLAKLHFSTHREIRSLLFSRWGKLEPEAAFGAAQSQGDETYFALGAVLEQWAQKDPAAATAAVAPLPSGYIRRVALSRLITAVAEQDPSQAFAMVKDYGQQRDAGSGVLSSWAAKRPLEAAAHVLELPSGQARNLAARAVASKWAKTDPESAIAWAESPEISEALTRDEMGRPNLVKNVLDSWFADQPDAATQWLENRPDSAAQRELLSSMVKSLGGSDPSRAMSLAVMIAGGSERDRSIHAAAAQWLRVEPDAARTWISQSSLPGNLKEELLDRKSP